MASATMPPVRRPGEIRRAPPPSGQRPARAAPPADSVWMPAKRARSAANSARVTKCVRLPFARVRQHHPAVVQTGLHGGVAPVRLDAALVKRLLADRIGGQIDPVVFCRIIDCRRLGRYRAPRQQVLHRDGNSQPSASRSSSRPARKIHAGLVKCHGPRMIAPSKDTGFDIACTVSALRYFQSLGRPVDQRRGHDGFDRFVPRCRRGADIPVVSSPPAASDACTALISYATVCAGRC